MATHFHKVPRLKVTGATLAILVWLHGYVFVTTLSDFVVESMPQTPISRQRKMSILQSMKRNVPDFTRKQHVYVNTHHDFTCFIFSLV